MSSMHKSSWAGQLLALVIKEFKQIVRDPSSYLVAVVLPIIFLLSFCYGISFDAGVMRIALINESDGSKAQGLALAFSQSPQFNVLPALSRAEASLMMRNSVVKGVVIIPGDFDLRLAGGQNAPVQVMVDGVEPNTAKFVQNYAVALAANWQLAQSGMEMPVQMQFSLWFNSSGISRWTLLPGSITVIMTLIGSLLTSLVVTREWERGTMESLFSTPVSKLQIILGKLIPYYCIAMISMNICTAFSVYLFDVPMRGSYWWLVLLSSAFLMPALGQGLLISCVFRSQLLAAQVGFLSGLLPSFILSGLIFDIHSMPLPLQYLTMVVPARYFNVCLQTLFLGGDIPSVFLPSMAILVGLGSFFMVMAYKKLRKTLD